MSGGMYEMDGKKLYGDGREVDPARTERNPDAATPESVSRSIEPADVGEALPSGLGGTVGTNEVCKCGHNKIYHEYLNTSPGDPITVIKGCDHSGCDCNKYEEAHPNG